MEANRRANTNAIFLDMGEEDRVKMGYSFNVPGSMLPPYVGSEQLFARRNHTLTAEGVGLLDAWRNLQSISMRDVFLGQTRAIILSEAFAKENIHELLDFIIRRVQVSGQAFVLVTPEDPEQVIDTKLNNNILPGEYIALYFQSAAKKNLARPIRVWEVYSRLNSESADVFMPLITVAQGQYRIGGTALFSKNSMVGRLDVDETQIVAFLDGANIGFLSVPMADGRLLALHGLKSKSSFTPRRSENGQITFEVRVDLRGLLREARPQDPLVTVDDKRRYEEWVERYTRDHIIQLLAKLQRLQTDPLDLGQYVRIKYPRYWESITWRQVYSQANFNVKVNFSIVDTGVFR